MTTTTAPSQTVFQALINDYVIYNAWANKQLADWLQTKPMEKMEQMVPSSFPTIKATLVHIFQTQFFWENILMETPFSEENPQNNEPSVTKVFENLVNQSEIFSVIVQNFSESELLDKVEIVTPWFTSNQPRYELIQHCMNHSTYHRGQLITMGRNLGLTDAPMTDFNFYLLMVKKGDAHY